MSLIHLARQGFITKSALPNVTRQRGTTTGTANLMLYGAGKDFAIGTNTTFTDSSSNNFTVTRNGDTIQATNNPFTGSVYFDGNGDYLTTPNNAAFTFGTGDFTIEFWARYESYGANGGNFISNTSDSLNIYYSNTGKLGYWNATVATDSSQTIPLNTWFHCAAVRSGTTLKLYYNGTQVLSVTESRNLTANNIVIGRNGSAGTYYLDGFMTNIRVVKGTAVYTANFTVPTSPLTAITNTQLLLLTAQQAPFRDSSTNNFTVTANGNAAGSGLEPFPVNYAGSAYFDGNGDYLTLAPGAAFQFGTGDFTVEMFVNFSNASNAYAFFVDARNSSQTTAWCLFRGNTGNLTWNTGSAELAATFTTTNTWQHIAYTRASNTGRLFINGVLAASWTDSTNYSVAPTTSYVGSRYSIAEFTIGYISNVRVIKGTAQYTAAFTPPAAPLTAVTNTSLLLLTNNVGPFVDTSANGFPVLRNGDAVQTGFSPFTGQPSAGAAYFDGTGDYLTIPASTATNFETSNFTIEAWVYLTTGGSFRRIYSLYGSGGTVQVALRTENTNTIRFFTTTSGIDFTSTTTLPLNSWNHLAVVRNGSAFNLYLNGVSIASATSSAAMPTTSTLPSQISGYDSSNEMWLGYISNLRVTKGTALYTSNFTPATAPLPAVTNTSLLLNTDNYTIANSTPTYLPVTVNGNTTVSTAQYPTGMNRSIYFDGNGDYLSIPDNTNLNMGTSDFTIEAFIYLSSAPGTDATILNKDGKNSVSWPQYALYVNNNYKVNLSLSSVPATGLNPTVLVVGATTLSLNTWYHVAATRVGTTATLWVNGVSDGSSSSVPSTLNNGARPLLVGWEDRTSPNTAYNFPGYISNLRVVKGAALYTANFTPPSLPMSISVTVPNFVTNNIYGVYQLA